MNRSAAIRTVRQAVVSTSHDSAAFGRVPSSCWRCRVSLLSSAPASLSAHPTSRLLHVSSASFQPTAASARSRPSDSSEQQLSHTWTEEHKDEDDDAVMDANWSPPAFRASPPDMSDLMAVAREGATKSAMDSPLHQTLAALVENGDEDTALSHLRSLHRTASADSWNLLLSSFAQRRRFDEVAAMWTLWQSNLPPLDSPLPANYDRLLLPNATTYGLLLRSPSNQRLLNASEALAQLKGRGQPVSTFLYNTLIKEHVYLKQYANANAAVDQMNSEGVAQDIYTVSMRFTILSKTAKRMEPARRYEEVCVLWDHVMALQLPRIPASLGFAFVWHICRANDSRRLVQLVQAIVSTSGPPDVVHQAKPVELMLGCLMKNDRLQEMIQLYRYMRRVGFKMRDKHFFVLVAGFARQGETNGMMRVFNEMVGHGVQPSLKLFETMLQAHGKVGDEEAAVRMIRRMSEFGVQPTIDCVCAIARGIHERQTALKSEAAEPSEQTGVSEVVQPTVAPTTVSAVSFVSPSPSLAYLPLFELTDELSMTPAPYIYHRLLQALHEETDLDAMLFFLYDMKHKGVALCLSELQWVLWQLSQLASTSPASAHVRLMVTRASLIVDGEESSLGALSSYYLLAMYIGVGDVASVQRVYHSIHERKLRVTWDIHLRMMQLCRTADSSDVREHERMHFVTLVYSHLLASEQRFGELIYNEALQAYAVLGDTAGMKDVLAAMRLDGVAMGESTLAVLNEAREHVEYTADIANYVTQQRNRIATLQMESSFRIRHKAELRQAAVAGGQGDVPTKLSAIDAPAVQPQPRQTRFTLPKWSPLYDQTEVQKEAEREEEEAAAAQVEELQSALTAFLSSLPAPIVHARHFPALEASASQVDTRAAAAGPSAKSLSTINKLLRSVKKRWPTAPGQSKESNDTAPAPPAIQQAASITRLQSIDSKQLPSQSASLSSASSPRTPFRAPAARASPFGLLSSTPQPGHIDLSTRGGGSVVRVTRRGTVGRLPRFSCASGDTVTARRMKAAMTRKVEERSSAAVTAAIEQSAHSASHSPVLPLPPATATATFFTAIESQAETVAMAEGSRRKRRARKASSVAESGTNSVKAGGRQRDQYDGGWTD